MTREMGKVLAETRGDVQEAIDAAYYNAGEGRRLFGPTVPSEMPNKFAMAVRQPIGVCGMITPWNFPMAISSWKLLPAHRLRQHLRHQARAGHSTLHFQSRPRPSRCRPAQRRNQHRRRIRPRRGTPLAEHPDVRAISLTGSSAVGRIIGGIAAKSFKHCSLELGGKIP